MELGYAQYNWDNWGIYYRFSGEIGFGGGVNLFSAQEITPTKAPISLTQIAGKDLGYNVDIGPLGFLYGGNQPVRPQGFEKFTKYSDDYKIGGFSISDGLKNFKLKPKINLGARASFGETWFLYKKR